MENQFLDQDVNKGEEGLSSQDMSNLLTAAKWSRFLGIVWFVLSGFMILGAIGMLTMGSALGSAMGGSGLMGAGFGIGIAIIYLIFAAPVFFLGLYMYRFGTRVKESQFSNNSYSMSEAFKNLKNYFQLSGILTAITIGLYLLIIVVAIGSAAAFG
jgi:Family of unknown function (DUF5362)